ncbi:hypothetical protein VL15_07305 [Burkholderia cepacia]|uniref:Uncharacterized protein n=1 Tax=Burkholderia cepacia TaxID=292 RepID=A0A0J5X1J8_BURCE|nr:hypothetical protein VL15_07305 [Burkholderia cepacia]
MAGSIVLFAQFVKYGPRWCRGLLSVRIEVRWQQHRIDGIRLTGLSPLKFQCCIGSLMWRLVREIWQVVLDRPQVSPLIHATYIKTLIVIDPM